MQNLAQCKNLDCDTRTPQGPDVAEYGVCGNTVTSSTHGTPCDVCSMRRALMSCACTLHLNGGSIRVYGGTGAPQSSHGYMRLASWALYLLMDGNGSRVISLISWRKSGFEEHWGPLFMRECCSFIVRLGVHIICNRNGATVGLVFSSLPLLECATALSG